MNEAEINRLQSLEAYRDGHHPDHGKVIDALVKLYSDEPVDNPAIEPLDESAYHGTYRALKDANRR